MQELDNQFQVTFSVTLSPAAMAAVREPGNSAHAVVTFAFDVEQVRCDGEISLRLTIKS